MASEAELSILIRLRDEASKGLEKVNEQIKVAKKEAEKTTEAWKFMGKTFTAAGVAIVGSMGLMVKVAEEERISIAKLENMLNNVGVAYGDVRKELEATMTATARKTGISDEAQREALSQLIMVTGNYENSVKGLSVALDLSAARNIDASSAAWTLGKAMAGNVTMLKRYGIQVKENATAGEVLIAVNNAVGGSARAMASPFAILKNELNELGESIGKVLLPALSGFVKLVTSLLSPLKWVVEHTGAFGKVLIYLTGALGLAALAVGALSLAIATKLVPSFIAGAGAAWSMIAPLLVIAAPVLAVVAAIAALAAGIYLIVDGVRKLINIFSSSGKAAKANADGVRRLKGDIAKLNEAQTTQQQQIDESNEKLKKLQAEYENTQRGTASYRAEVKRLNDEIIKHQTQVDSLKDSLAAAYDELEKMTNPNLTGMGEYKDKLFDIDQQIAALQLKGLQFGETPDLLAQIAALEKERDILELQSKLDFGSVLHDLQDMADAATGASTEIAPKDAIARMNTAIGQIVTYTAALSTANTALTTDQTTLNTMLQVTQGQLDIISERMAVIQSQIYSWTYGEGGLQTFTTQIDALLVKIDELLAKMDKAKAGKGGSFWDFISNPFQYLFGNPPTAKGYQHGGIVPGPIGAPVPVIAHGGEEFLGVGTSRRSGTNVYVTVQGSVTSERDLATTIREQLLRVKGRNYDTGI